MQKSLLRTVTWALKKSYFGLSLRVPIENRDVAIRPEGSLRGEAVANRRSRCESRLKIGTWQPRDCFPFVSLRVAMTLRVPDESGLRRPVQLLCGAPRKDTWRDFFRDLVPIILFSLLLVGCLPEGEKEKPKGAEMKIYIIPVGDVEKDTLLRLSWALREQFQAAFEIGEPLPILEDDYRAERGQYFATPILEELKQNIPQDAEKVLGVLDVDIFVPALNFIFGQADLGGRVALISLTRLREEFYRNEKNDKLFMERVLKEAVHELGHTFGLRHCQNAKCVMHFSNSLMDTDAKQADFCEECQRELEIRLR